MHPLSNPTPRWEYAPRRAGPPQPLSRGLCTKKCPPAGLTGGWTLRYRKERHRCLQKKRHALTCLFFWRRHPDLNRGSRICSPMPYHLAMAPKNWSGQRDSNSLPPPWQGGALPNELCPHFVNASVIVPQKDGLSSVFSLFSDFIVSELLALAPDERLRRARRAAVSRPLVGTAHALVAAQP